MRMRIGSVANPASIDHAGLGSLDSDDHPLYHTDARGNVLYGYQATVTVTSAELLALNAAPVELIAAPGAGKAIIPVGMLAVLVYGTTAYDGIAAGEDLTIKYTDGTTGALATLETTGFLDAEADAYRWVTVGNITPVANAPLVLHLLVGEIATGDSDLEVTVFYRVIDL